MDGVSIVESNNGCFQDSNGFSIANPFPPIILRLHALSFSFFLLQAGCSSAGPHQVGPQRMRIRPPRSEHSSLSRCPYWPWTSRFWPHSQRFWTHCPSSQSSLALWVPGSRRFWWGRLRSCQFGTPSSWYWSYFIWNTSIEPRLLLCLCGELCIWDELLVMVFFVLVFSHLGLHWLLYFEFRFSGLWAFYIIVFSFTDLANYCTSLHCLFKRMLEPGNSIRWLISSSYPL